MIIKKKLTKKLRDKIKCDPIIKKSKPKCKSISSTCTLHFFICMNKIERMKEGKKSAIDLIEQVLLIHIDIFYNGNFVQFLRKVYTRICDFMAEIKRHSFI